MADIESTHVKTLSLCAAGAVRNPSVPLGDKERLVEAIDWLGTFPFYLVSPTEESIDAIRQEADAWDKLSTQKERRAVHFRMRELTCEAQYNNEYNHALGQLRGIRGEDKLPRYNLNTAKALATQDWFVQRYHKWWFWCKACRKEAEIIAKLFHKTGKSNWRKYHLAKDKAEGKLSAVSGG